VQRTVGRARRGGDAAIYRSGHPLAVLVFAATLAAESQRSARARRRRIRFSARHTRSGWRNEATMSAQWK